VISMTVREKEHSGHRLRRFSPVKNCNHITSFRVNFGVRQGSALSPFLFNIYLDDVAKLHNYNNRSFVIVYADDILLITRSVSKLQKLLSACENELQLLDMVINIKKSCCLRIGPRCNVSCANISSHDGRLFFMGFQLRYLAVFIVRSHVFKFSLVYAKRSFHRAVNSLFGTLLNLLSEVVIFGIS